ncbi:MAG TPA: nuclear transport factor 2 family protein [Thermoleophilaceae bacterium]|nr:nuclear transport factor 2 family protein [Thermoleophilaceae bacterium]
MSSPFDRYVAAWNAGDLDGWLDAHAPDAEYVTFAGPEPRTFAGHDGLREAWAEGRANWEVFRFQVLGDEGGVLEVGFRGIEQVQGIELSGVLWFRVDERDGRLARVWSALDANELP